MGRPYVTAYVTPVISDLISDFWFLISDFWFLISDFWFRVSGFWSLISDFWFRISDFGFLISNFGFRISLFQFSDVEFQIKENSSSDFAKLISRICWDLFLISDFSIRSHGLAAKLRNLFVFWFLFPYFWFLNSLLFNYRFSVCTI